MQNRPLTDAAGEANYNYGLRDLLRAAGVLDRRTSDALTKPRHCPLEQDTLLVGIHARRQQTGDVPVLVVTMVAIHATPDPGIPWRVTMYDELDRAWRPMGTANGHFHAGDIGMTSLGRGDDKAAATRDHVEHRLAELVTDRPDVPVVIFTDAQATRTIWPGMQDKNFGKGPMPADTLGNGAADIAVVRCNNRLTEIGRPVTRLDNQNRPGDSSQPAAPGRRLYQVTDSTAPVWYFPGTSRTYGGRFGRTGASYTRWTIPPDQQSLELRRPWHAYTAIEFAVVRHDNREPVALAALAARLCEQAASWDGRVRYPTPLHFAACADKDHPGWRASGDDPIADDTPDAVAFDSQRLHPWA